GGFVVRARSQSRGLIGWMEGTLEGRVRLTVNRDKARVVKLRQAGESLDFPGFTPRYDRARQGPWRYRNVFASKRPVARARARVRAIIGPRREFVPIPELVAEVNRSLDGWGGYFRHGY